MTSNLKMTGGSGVARPRTNFTFQGLSEPPVLPPWLRVMDTGRVSGASALSTPRLPWLPPPPAPPAAHCLKGGSSPGTSFSPHRWISLRPSAIRIPRLEPSLAALLFPGAGWRPNEKPLPPDRLQKQFVCTSQSAAAVNNIALLCPGLPVGWQGGLRPGGGHEMAGGFPLLQRHPSAVPAGSRFGRPGYGVGHNDPEGHMALSHCCSGTRVGQPRPGPFSSGWTILGLVLGGARSPAGRP